MGGMLQVTAGVRQELLVSRLIEYITVFILGAIIPTILFVQNWPDEHTFNNGSVCTVLALQELDGTPNLDMNTIYKAANEIKHKKPAKKLWRTRR